MQNPEHTPVSVLIVESTNGREECFRMVSRGLLAIWMVILFTEQHGGMWSPPPPADDRRWEGLGF